MKNADEYILVFDLGTTSLKTVLYTRELSMAASAEGEYPTNYPHPLRAEQNPDDWLTVMRETTGQVIEQAGVSKEDIKIIAIDAMTPVLVCTDKQGESLRPAMLWMDRRASEQCWEIDAMVGRKLFEINGNHNDPSNLAPKIMWVRDNEPEIYEKTDKFLFASSWLVYRLTGVAVTDKTQCGLSQLCDTRTGEWSDELIQGCGLDRSRLADVVDPTAIVGSLTESAASFLSLSENTLVIAGAMDNVAAGLGSGVYDSGQVYISAGTATNGCVCTDKPVYNDALHIYHHIVPGHWLNVAGVDYGGAGLKWFRNILGDLTFEELVGEVEKRGGNLSSLVFLPYMVGQRAPLWNSATRGVIFGLDPSVDRADLANMFMVGNAMGIRNIFSIVEKLGIAIGEIKLTGGCSRSVYYSRIFADVTGRRVQVAGETDVASLGMAMAAAYAMGWYGGFEEMAGQISQGPVYVPDRKESDYYGDLYRLFSELYEKLGEQYESLNKIREKYGKEEVRI